MWLVAGLKQRSEIVRSSLVPQLLEPFLNLGHHMRRVVAEVQLQVRGKTGIGEVRRAGDNAVGAVADDECLAMQEATLEAAHVDVGRSQPIDQPARGSVRLQREAQMVALEAKILLLIIERSPHPCPCRSLGLRRLCAERPSPVLGRLGFCPHEQPYPGGLVERIGKQGVPTDIEVGRRDVNRRTADEPSSCVGDEAAQRPGDGPTVAIDRQLRLLNDCHAAS